MHFCSKDEFRHFRQLLVNVVISTDIFDKDVKELRQKLWAKEFQQQSLISEEEAFNLSWTIAIEHIMKASDVSHTMQHWHVYTKWNFRLFMEMYGAYYLSGTGEIDSSIGWYKGELWFFDKYVIPRAKKLEEREVVGEPSNVCLSYATAKRKECGKPKGKRLLRSL
jgi:hypothetical protein